MKKFLFILGFFFVGCSQVQVRQQKMVQLVQLTYQDACERNLSMALLKPGADAQKWMHSSCLSQARQYVRGLGQ
jgi:hypothetical protein